MNYTVQVFSCKQQHMNVLDRMLIKLVGEDGESTWTFFTGVRSLISNGKVKFSLYCPAPIGKLVLVELKKQKLPLVPEHNWFIDKVEVTSPEGTIHKFPVYHWIKRNKVYHFNEGTALRDWEDTHVLRKQCRKEQLKRRTIKYCWDTFSDGIPHCMKGDTTSSLPSEIQFSFTKDIDFKLSAFEGLVGMKLRHLAGCQEPWKDFHAVSQVFSSHKNDVSDYVSKHWKEDTFFGYQVLNGINPMMIKRCRRLPDNFPVTSEMVGLGEDSSLDKEMKKDNIFLCDYKQMDKVETNTINEQKQYLMAPLVLLHKTPAGELKPIAIQLKQTPGEDNPIFLPSDSEYDWLLAKTFVRSADFNEHQLNVHLLRTHLLAEVFAVSLLRNVPDVHPLYKLLVPHTRYTLQINLMARQSLISENGVFTQFTASGGKGMITILQRSLSSLTYSSLCIPDDIINRGVESVPNYYYRDDGLQLWDIIHRFVEGVITHYYKNDKEIQKDTELQNYIKDIFEHGFLSNEKTGIPQSFETVHELVKFVTMVIFTCSAQHSAVNNGQFDFGGWMPNTPTTLQLSPPTEKNKATEKILLETLPDISTTVNAMTAIRLLSTQSADFVALGQYPNKYFSEDVPCKLIEEFQLELEELDQKIDTRNKDLKLPYTYLKPTMMENSVSL